MPVVPGVTENGQWSLLSEPAMKNLAILIAVAEYSGECQALPACHRDGIAMKELIDQTNKFSDVLLIANGEAASVVKQKIADFIKGHDQDEVGDFLFYFTGHGDFSGQEFYYLLSDYTQKRKNETALQNSEVDSMIRGLRPSNYIKIVDACHSGIKYIKDNADLAAHLKGVNSEFRNVYFLFSSQSDQYSYQDGFLSYFTESIILSVLSHTADRIRYKDVMSFVSDAFGDRSEQTPVFVSQASFTEQFCEVTDALRRGLAKFRRESPTIGHDVTIEMNSRNALVRRLKEQASEYCDKAEVHDILGGLKETLMSLSMRDAYRELYNIGVDTSLEVNSIPGIEFVGKWLSGPGRDLGYFAKPKIGVESYKKAVPKTDFMHLMSLARADSSPYYYEDATRNVVTGVVVPDDAPIACASIRLDPLLPNLAPETMNIVFVYSRTLLRVFWCCSHFEYVDWEKARRIGTPEWASVEVSLKKPAEIRNAMDGVLERFLDFVEAGLKELLKDGEQVREAGAVGSTSASS